MAADDNVWVEQDVGGRPCYKNVTTNAVAWTLPEGGRLQRDTTQSPIVSGTVTVSGASVPLEMAGDGDEEAPAVVVSGKVITPAHPAIVAVRSLNSQHSLMTLHSHVSEEHAKHDEGKPQKGAMFCIMGLIILVAVGMVFTMNGLAIWSIVLYEDMKETKCKKLAAVLLWYGLATILNTVFTLVFTVLRKTGGGDDDEHKHKEKETTFALISFGYMCFGFAIVTGNPPSWWGDGATNRDRCDPSGDIWPQMEDLFITAFSISMGAVFCCGCAVCASAASS